MKTWSITPLLGNEINIQTVGDTDEVYYTRLFFMDSSEYSSMGAFAFIEGKFMSSSTGSRNSGIELNSNFISLTGTVYVLGNIVCQRNPSENSHLTNKSYVDNAIASALSASDAMVFKGTVGTSGTVASISVMDYSTAATGEHDLTPGDLIVYMGESKFIYVPSGDEDVTSIKVAGSGDTINVSTTAQTGTVVLGDVATKKVSTSTTLNGNGASNDNVATELAVKTYVDDAVTAATLTWKTF